MQTESTELAKDEATQLTLLTQCDVDKILQEHLHWLNKDCDNWVTKRADFSNCKLEYVDFSNKHCLNAIFDNTCIEFSRFNNAILTNTSFKNAIIKNTNFSNAMLSSASFENAVIKHTDFTKAMLIGAKFRYTHIQYSLFRKSVLTETAFNHSSCTNVDFRCSSCIDALFTQSQFINSDFEYANIYNAFFDAKESVRYGQILKEPLIGYKKTCEGVIITAEIPAGAIVFSINNSKCRANKAKIIDMNGYKLLHSNYDTAFTYTLGQQIEIDNFNTSYNVECGAGFHFFKTRDEAIAYKF